MIGIREDTHTPAFPDNTVAILTDNTFAPQGWLEEKLGLEHRPEQESMAQSVARSFISNHPLLVEAGTGVGKSLAYLIPGLLHAIIEKRPFLVSSHTIALQEQIKNKDLEICRHLFSQVEELSPFKDFKVAMLVGRGNYLCGHRLETAIRDKADLLGGPEQDELHRIALWSGETQSGLKEELNPPPSHEVWEWVNADSSSCNKRNCNHQSCFYRRALLQRSQAHVIIVNHSLLFSLIGAGLSPGKNSRGILYPDDFLVLDEAHRVPDIASDHFGLGISAYSVDRALKKLYNPRPKKPRGLLLKYGKRPDQIAVTHAIAIAEEFFNDIKNRYLTKKAIVRLHTPNWVDPILMSPLLEVIQRLKNISQQNDNPAVTDELRDSIRSMQSFVMGLSGAIELSEEEHVYWLERTGSQGKVVHIRSAPLNVSSYLNEHIFVRDTSAILTSATMATNGTMDGFQNQVGAWNQSTQIEASPFDFENNMQVYIATDAPLPSADQGRLDLDYLANMICHCSLKVKGGTLALFTRYADMSKVAALIQESLENAGRTLLIQGDGHSRSDLKRFFVEAGDAVLLGTDSFWTGFDVPGPALSQVIMTRLPFLNPTQPLAEAKSEWIKTNGGSPFTEMILPDALIKFRQGVGRLIRKQTDKGIVTILDSRMLNREYGRQFIESLPCQKFIKINKKNRNDIPFI